MHDTAEVAWTGKQGTKRTNLPSFFQLQGNTFVLSQVIVLVQDVVWHQNLVVELKVACGQGGQRDIRRVGGEGEPVLRCYRKAVKSRWCRTIEESAKGRGDQVSQRQLEPGLAIDQEHGNVRNSYPVRYRSEAIVRNESGMATGQLSSFTLSSSQGRGVSRPWVTKRREAVVRRWVEGCSCLVFLLVERRTGDTRKGKKATGTQEDDRGR